MKADLRALRGGNKQHFNRENADLIRKFHDTMGFEKTKEVFSLKDGTLVSILKRQDRDPAVRKVDKLQLRALDIENHIHQAIRDGVHHGTRHDSQQQLFSVLVEVLDKVIVPILRTMAEVNYTAEIESRSDFTLSTDNVNVTSSRRRKYSTNRNFL